MRTVSQRSHHKLHTCNEELAAFNGNSAEQHARLEGRLKRHANTLRTLQSQLLNVFQRVRALRARLLKSFPELHDAAAAADARREADIELAREHSDHSIARRASDTADNQRAAQQAGDAELNTEAMPRRDSEHE